MKTTMLTFLICLSCIVKGQQFIPAHKKVITYKVTIININGKISKGYLAGFDDSTVFLLPYNFSKNRMMISKHETFDKFSYQQIDRISFRRKSSTGRGILFGGIIGSAVGLIVGGIVGEQTEISKGSPGFWFFPAIAPGTKIVTASANEVMFKYSFIAAAAGEIIGGTIGLFSTKKYYVKGLKENFDNVRNTMISKMYR